MFSLETNLCCKYVENPERRVEADLHMMLQKPNWVRWVGAFAVGCAGKSGCAGRKSDAF